MNRLLIADAQMDWCEFSREVLSTQGYDVSIAEDVKTLREFLKANRYDLVLVNIDLIKQGFGKPFHELLMVRIEEPIFVLIMPSYGATTIQQTRVAFKCGAMDCVDRPLSPQRLLSLVQQLLEECRERLPNKD